MTYHSRPTYNSYSSDESDYDYDDDYIESSDRDDYIDSHRHMQIAVRSRVQNTDSESETSSASEEEQENEPQELDIEALQQRHYRVVHAPRPPITRTQTVAGIPSRHANVPISRNQGQRYYHSTPPPGAFPRTHTRHAHVTTAATATPNNVRRYYEDTDTEGDQLFCDESDDDDLIGSEDERGQVDPPGPLRLQHNPMRLTPKHEECHCGRPATRCSSARERAAKIEQ